MKKILLTFLTISLGVALFAQKTDPVRTRAEKFTEAQAKELGLTDDQKNKFVDAKVNRINKVVALNQKYGADRANHQADYKKVQEEFKAEIKTFLTADQYSKWEAEKAKRREVRKKNMEEKAKANPTVPAEKFDDKSEDYEIEY